ncbi:hypothetical protein Kpol_455p7 [Vanderwaltozyma polyspora DSM 70294]|uniref:Glutamine amidotransferase type-2 domain-containing protein n=1 Tax=Vanderwaltozyma polyspora (strain ATCC 22028 / DSM 70294 / BCRC 21397 / CBS 2163 / NBRC 10782 / NRRL Y-8283 / UCD 57-17) TaxID=436907 RepID=A7TR28_VANPO|nr:uncharacterized protein Kpol_455p7 [Vanderwaltozyma polyspora DSM 70294]EDO15276.1 hypothetical protein Kpol_455p7 [Vanderwaltozyma polyspora DSM 70294]
MCGILLHYLGSLDGSRNDLIDEVHEYDESYSGDRVCSDGDGTFNEIIPYIVSRGPNYSSLRVNREHGISWFSSILSLRQPFTRQSIVVDERYVLQFNGELYNSEISGNDTQYIVSLLKSCDGDVVSLVRKLDGGFAYTIYDLKEGNIYFGRDTIGKRSLCYSIDENSGELFISSVTGTRGTFVDCLGGVIYTYDTKTHTLDDTKVIRDKYVVTDMTDELENESQYMELLYGTLYESVKKRVLSIHPTHIENSPISILFSGGLDCSVIVALICEVLKTEYKGPNIVLELLNVGFENPRTGKMPHETPDRLLAVNSYKIIQELYPDIDICLVEVDVPYDEYLRVRPKVVDLIYPKQTEMDLSIAIAFYFASRGHGFVTNSDNERNKYNRNGIVLFSGLGADELYGGYHSFANKSIEELTVELTRQINNIHDRNLNRDDKVIADNGVEVRYPFLDEEVIQYSVSQIPISYKVNKGILRKLALEKLQLRDIAQEPKRAIQFGARSAKMTKDGNKNGTDVIKA